MEEVVCDKKVVLSWADLPNEEDTKQEEVITVVPPIVPAVEKQYDRAPLAHK